MREESRKGILVAISQDIKDMKLSELKQLAKQMGLRGTSTMRKPELIATLQAARSGGQAPEGVSAGAPVAEKQTTASSAVPTGKKSGGVSDDVESGAKESSSPFEMDNGDHAEDDSTRGVAGTTRVAGGDAAQDGDMPEQGELPVQDQENATHLKGSDSRIGHEVGLSDADAGSSDDEGKKSAVRRAPVRGRSLSRGRRAGGMNLLEDLGLDSPRRRNHDEDSSERKFRRHPLNQNVRANSGSAHDEGQVRNLDDILATLPVAEEGNRSVEVQPSLSVRRGRMREERYARNDSDRGRTRQRRIPEREDESDVEYDDRNSRAHGNHDYRAEEGVEPAPVRRGARRDEANLVPVAGIVDVLDSYAFIRTSGYLPGANDIYVSMGQIRKYGLRKGDAVHGFIRPVHEGDRRNQRQKFVPLQSIETINGVAFDEVGDRPNFSKLTPLYPQERLKQETVSGNIIGRLVDLVAPIGKGQRGLIVSPPKAGKTITLQNIANSITTNNPEVHLMVVLVDERPEEVTDMERTVQGEVISSTFDRPASDHTTVAELAIERAKRLVELGQDVVVLLDSMTRLARAYNIAAPASGRILSGGVDAQALYPPKKFFGAARNIENGGSLTIIASALVETGSKMDEVIFEEFKGTGNMELRLSRELADKRLFPAIDMNASGTRREELITAPDELAVIYRLRRLLGGMEPEQAYQTIVPRMKKTATNRDFLKSLIQQQN